MIGIRAANEEILKFLPQLGIGRHSVAFNPSSLQGLSVVVQVGGPGVRTSHCYVQDESGVPYITCLEPETARAEPLNKMWILCALSKAQEIDDGKAVFPKAEFKIRPTLEEVGRFLCSVKGPLSVDLECDRDTHEITVFGFAYRDGGTVRALSVPLVSEQLPYWNEEDEATVWKLVAAAMASSRDKVFQNFIFDTMMLSYNGIETSGRILCTMTAQHWISPLPKGQKGKGLADLGRMYLNVDVWKERDSWASNDSLWLYNAKDAAYTLLILEKQMEEMRDAGRLDFYATHLTDLATQVLRLCERGWTLDHETLSALRDSEITKVQDLLGYLQNFAAGLLRPKVRYRLIRTKNPPAGARLARGCGTPTKSEERQDRRGRRVFQCLEFAEYEEVKLEDVEPGTPLFEIKVEEHDFNPASPLDVKAILHALDVRIPLKDGKETTDETALLKVIANSKTPPTTREFLERLLDYRGSTKLISTYLDHKSDFDGRTRFSIVIPGTVEGRFASSQTPWETGFNSQNIPKSFRHLVIPSDPGWSLVNMDFRAADPHMVAWLSNERTMLQILNDPKGDLHAHTASGIFGYDITKELGYDKDTSRERKLGKACNNGLNYGMQIGRFIETCRKQGLVISLEEAAAAHRGYFSLYPGIKAWQDSIRQRIIQSRTLATPFGRRRYFHGFLNEKLFNEAYSYIPPTTVADALNIGWLSLDAKRGGLHFRVLGQCHDSLLLECPDDEVGDTVSLMRRVFTGVRFQLNGFDCNFPIEIAVGKSWGSVGKVA